MHIWQSPHLKSARCIRFCSSRWLQPQVLRGWKTRFSPASSQLGSDLLAKLSPSGWMDVCVEGCLTCYVDTVDVDVVAGMCMFLLSHTDGLKLDTCQGRNLLLFMHCFSYRNLSGVNPKPQARLLTRLHVHRSGEICRKFAMTADGSVIAGAGHNSYWVSTDSGATWTRRSPVEKKYESRRYILDS